MKNTPIFMVMGVSGSGKSTIGRLLAEHFKFPFFDGDDFHPEENVEKMSNGIPLTDSDRAGWLQRLNKLAKRHEDGGAVIACSALKKSYRDRLKEDLASQMTFIHLKGSKKQILNRLEKRKNHFMPTDLLDSQFSTLETPEKAITVAIDQTPDQMVSEIIRHFKAKKP